MTNFFCQLKSWFKPKSAKKKRICPPKITKPQLVTKLNNSCSPINHQPYRQLIGQLAKRAVAIQRTRQRRNC